jgi:pimeloyl-ACP methyl ester carboxylesterase
MNAFMAVSATAGRTRSADVIFIHGLAGDPIATWHPPGKPDDFWPKWLAEDLPAVGVWSFGYSAPVLKFTGAPMALVDRAVNALAYFESAGIGEAPIIFVAHSLGGLLVKQIVRHCAEFPSPFASKILGNTKGVIFLGTPHSGSQMATWTTRLLSLVTGPIVSELVSDSPQLRELNTWYRSHVGELHIKHQVYAETKAMAGGLVVDQASADPGVPDLIPIPVEADHISLAKPASRESLLYQRVRTFVVHAIETDPKSGLAPPSELGPSLSIAVTSALPEAKLRRLLTERVERAEVAVFWFDTLGESKDDQIPGKSHRECVIELLFRTKRRKVLERLYEAIALERPDIADLLVSLGLNSTGGSRS